MSRRIIGLAAGAAFALTSLGGAIAQAQPAPPPEHAAPMRERATPEQRVEKLVRLLQLRPDQRPAALAFVTAVSPGPGKMHGEHRAERPATTPERLALMEQRMGEHQARMKQRIDATRRFYAQLDPAQQKAFDALPMGGRGGEHGHHMRGHGG